MTRMEYIDKNINAAKGESIVCHFLAEVHNTFGSYSSPKGTLYDVFRFPCYNRYYNQMRAILCAEQNGRCCYCMRRLDDEDVTVEHLIVKTFKDGDRWSDYMSLNTVLSSKVCLESDFVDADQTIGYRKFPHTVAYQNMVLSCKGMFTDEETRARTCNIKRGHRELAPLVLKHTIHREVTYNKSGMAYWENDPMIEKPAINTLGLNNGLLKMIRRIWKYARDNRINLFSVNDRCSFLYEMLGDQVQQLESENEWRRLMVFEKESFWNAMLKYDYFGGQDVNWGTV